MKEENLKVKKEEGVKEMKKEDVLKGRKVVIFEVKGEFKKKCRMKKMKGYIEKRDEIIEKGVEKIEVVEVKEKFVMGEWEKRKGGEGKIILIEDGREKLKKEEGIDIDI